MSIQSKITFIVAGVCIFIVSLFGIAIYWFLHEYSYTDFYQRLETRAKIAARYSLEADELDTNQLRLLREKHLVRLENEREFVVNQTDSSQLNELQGKHQIPADVLKILTETGTVQKRDGQTFYVGFMKSHKANNYLVLVSAENYYATHHMHFLQNVLIGVTLFACLIVFLLSVFFSRQIFLPLKHIISEVKKISSGNIHLRIESKTEPNEIDELIQTFNDLLNRIETAFETQKNFISNASHELSTPLTSIIGEADVTLLKERSTDEYQQTLRNIMNQADRLDQITKSLLFLAQTGYTNDVIQFEKLRVDEILYTTKEVIDKLNPRNKITIDLALLPEDSMKLKVWGNQQLLQLAFANILNNACKYSNNEQVMVYIASSNQKIIITIKDKGIGIPERELAYIYDPFFRASNTKLFDGYGIGLPLSRNIVRIHHGELLVSSEPNEGTMVQIKLPVYTPKF